MTDSMPTFGDASVNALAYTRRQEIAFLTLPQASRGDEPQPYALEVSLPSSDLDGDGNLAFAGKFGSWLGQERYAPRCDLNGDAEIDLDDFLILAADFGSSG